METKKEKTHRARVYTSPLIDEIFDNITPVEMEQSRIRMTLAARIEDCLGEAGLNKSQLAKLLNRHPSEITKWMSGTHNFTIDTLVEIAVALNVKVEALFVLHQAKTKKPTEVCLQSTGLEPVILLMTPLVRKSNSSQLSFSFESEHWQETFSTYQA